MSAPPRKTLLIVPLTQEQPAAMRAGLLAAAAAGADAAEARLDYLADTSPQALHALLAETPCPVILTCRSANEGGRFTGSEAQRLAVLQRAAKAGGQWVDLELASLPAAGAMLETLGLAGGRGLILSAHDFRGRPAGVMQTLARMEASPGAVNKIAFMASGPEDALAAFDLLRASRKPMLALAMGECGVASRILAGKFGGFGTFAALEPGAESAPGQPTLRELRELYRWDRITPETKVYGVVGCPVAHSMSPAIHNAAFSADGLDAVYVPLRVEPGRSSFDRFIDAVLERPWAHLAGLSVTIPHKENALARVGPENVDELARAIGAVNTILFTGERGSPMRGWNTDYAAAMDALAAGLGGRREDLRGREVAVLGAGGAARAIVAALAHYGANVTIYNRTLSRAERLAEEFASPSARLAAAPMEAAATARAEIIVNCTPIGMWPATDASPLPVEFPFPEGALVFDTIYNPVRTLLLRRAAQASCRTVTGVDMFVNQAVAQYEIWTGRAAPREIMRRVVLSQLG